jgi:hypothetical protein
MKCREAIPLIHLHAGGDLPDSRIPELIAHIKSCPKCETELERSRRMLEKIRQQSREELPRPLPDNFAQGVIREIERETTEGNEPRRSPREILRTRYVTIAISAAAVILLTAVVWLQRELNRMESDMESMMNIAIEMPLVTAKVMQFFLDGPVQGPVPVDEWQPTNEAGVFFVLHRPDPENRPDVFTVDYCGERKRLGSYYGYPWINQRARKILSRAGSRENVFVAVYPMPGSTEQQREDIKWRFVKKYEPFFNEDQGV